MVTWRLLSLDIFENLKETGRKDICYVLNDNDAQYKMGVEAERSCITPKCVNVLQSLVILPETKDLLEAIFESLNFLILLFKFLNSNVKPFHLTTYFYTSN